MVETTLINEARNRVEVAQCATDKVPVARPATTIDELLHNRSRCLADDDAAFRERLTRELKYAREIQERTHPRKVPITGCLDYCGFTRPAEEVGGDYYDFLRLPNGKVGIAIGDACGKGVPAALLIAGLQSALRAQPLPSCSPAVVVRSLNRLLYHSSAPDRFASLFYAVYDPTIECLTYVNAGHNPPFVLRDELIIRLHEGGPVIGVLPDVAYQEATLALEPADLIVLYTDGVTEAINPLCEDWGEGRLVDTARLCRTQRVDEIAARLIAAADQFVAGAAQHDDMTVAVVQLDGHHRAQRCRSLASIDDNLVTIA